MVLATGWWMAIVDASYDSQLDQMIVATINKFTVAKNLTDGIAYSSIPCARAPYCLPP